VRDRLRRGFRQGTALKLAKTKLLNSLKYGLQTYERFGSMN
jgi:hypothetical protein